MGFIDRLHGGYVHNRRVEVLSRVLAELMPEGARVLDVGCGDGLLVSLIHQRRPDLMIEGIDIMVRPNAYVPVTPFNGEKIPFDDNSFDVVMFVDVLHHTNDPTVLLKEATRVAKKAVLLKDHTQDGFLAGPTLRFMDWVGNARHGVALPYNYWPEHRWRQTFQQLGLGVEHWTCDVPLYPRWAAWAVTRRLHFVARLATPGPAGP